MVDVNTEIAPDLGTIGQEETPAIDGRGEIPEVTDGRGELEVEDNSGIPVDNEKDLKSRYTKVTQEYSDFQKRFEKQEQELATFRQMYTEQNKPVAPVSPDKELSAKEYAALEPMEQLDYLVDKRIAKNVKPYIDKIGQLENYIQANIQQESQRVWNEFVATHPDAANMGNDLAQVIAKHNMPLDKAYKFLKADMALPEAKQEVLKEMQVKKDASKLMKPVSTPTTPANDRVNSFEEAFEKTLKGLGKQ